MKWFTFRSKLLLLGLVPVLVLGILIGVLLFSQSKNIISDSQKAVVADTINRIDINLNAKVRSINGYLHLAVDDMPEFGWQASVDASAMMEPFCTRMRDAAGGLYSVTLFQDGEAMYVSAPGTSTPDLDTVQQLLEEARSFPDKAIWSGLSISLYGTNQKVVRVYELVPSSPAGLLVVELPTTSFSDMLLAAQTPLSAQHTFVADKHSNILASTQSVDQGWMGDVLENWAQGKRKFTFEWNNELLYCCGQYNGLTGWTTFSVIAVEKLFPQADELLRYICMVISVTVALMLLFILLLYQSITRPLNLLSQSMKAAQDQNFTLRLPKGRADEIGSLTNSFNDMMDRMDQLINEVYQQKLAQQSAEMEALQAQINPHFLYNTLDSINWMLIDRGALDISDLVVSLGNLMRYSIASQPASVPLLLEYQYVQDYLSIQKCRLTSRLQYTLELAPELEDFAVPRLILQPLVENAIRHGVEPMPKGGLVTISAHQLDSDVVISVIDNGKGIPPEQLARLRAVDKFPAASTSIGVHNVERRMQLYFGEGFRLSIESEQGRGTVVTMFIARRREETDI